jgi:hypothetical protein
MFNSSVLDVAIGAVFIFLLLSVFATAINEIIFSFLNMRGRELLRGISTLLSDAQKTGLVRKVYNHGQVFGLFEGNFDPDNPGKLPSYIPSKNFALALLDAVAHPFSEVSPAQPAAAAAQPGEAAPPGEAAQPGAVGQPGRAAQAGAPAGIAQETIVLTQAFNAAAKELAQNPATEKIGKPLVSMITMAGNDAARLQKSVEDWYNSGMDRVSGWYKYKTQWMLFAIGLVIAAAINADTIHIVKQLSQDATVRASIVAAAESAKEPQIDKGLSTQARMDAAKKSLSDINNVGIPLGWHRGDWSANHAPNLLLGWLLTAIAVSLGAPFWFDTLNKIMVVRSTVKPREKSQDEGSKDKPRS